jgi:hypothetical protein
VGAAGASFGRLDEVRNACQRWFRGTKGIYRLGRLAGNNEVDDFVAGFYGRDF